MKKSVGKPIKYGNKPASVPLVMQLEILECGAACLTMIMAYYGRWITLEEAREDCGVSRDGQNALNIIKAARKYKMQAQGFKMDVAAFQKYDKFPCIIHWEFNHFIVLKGVKNNKFYVNDPGLGERVLSYEEFDEGFTGIVLSMVPTDEFEVKGKPKSIYSFARKRLSGALIPMIILVLTSIITMLTGILEPIYSKIFLDRILSGQNPEWITPFIFILLLMGIVFIVVEWINTISSLKINGKMAVVGNSTFMWKVLNLPMRFFSQRMAGDIQQRQESYASISKTLMQTYVPLVFDTISMVFYLVILLRYSVMLSLIGIASIVINYVFSKIIADKSVNISRVLQREMGKLYGTTVSGIEMIETIKASGSEVGFFEKWAGYQANVNAENIKSMKLSEYLGVLPSIVSCVLNDIILLMGIFLVLRGEFTLGSVTAFVGLLNSFTGPATSLISANQSILEMRTEMERIEDVMEYPSDDAFASLSEEDNADCYTEKLRGRVELRNVTFGYSPLSKPLIEDFNLTLEPGSKVAFVGMSGCGKSTLSKLISGLYQPWSGEILFDGKPMKSIDKNVFRSSVAVVDQDIILFNDTIRNNITMWDKTIMDFEVIMAARDAQIYEDIISRPGDFDYVIDENGKDLSGGQRQRIEIARVLAMDPSIIIMDEATSALDAMTEFNVVKSITDRGISCIVVAHRLSTIRDCDEIIVMDKGVVVERGTHEELMQRNGLYKELVTSE